MSKSDELKRIKKLYGENFMKLCRSLFPTLLEQEGVLLEILTSSFATNSRTLYDDIVNNGLEYKLKEYVFSKIDVEDKEKKTKVDKSPYELLDEAGYDLYECKTEKEIQEFKKYYAKGEELCTFRGGRLDRCEVFFAVKKDVENIKRKNFKKPKREDEYGTSVMGIQFNKKGLCTVSIKNRYNHTVNNPDATYGNDLDRIIPGLTQSFTNLLEERGLELNSSNVEKFAIPGWTVAGDGKYYKYNMEIDGIYYCPKNIIIQNGEVKKLENPEKQILIENFVLDLQNKTLTGYVPKNSDAFLDAFKNIEKIDITKNKEKGTREIIIEKSNQESPITIEIDEHNQIIGYRNLELKELGYFFLWNNKMLTWLDVPNVEKIGNYVLGSNKGLLELDIPNVEDIGREFLENNVRLNKMIAPKLKTIGFNSLCENNRLVELDWHNIERIGYDVLRYNYCLTKLNVPQLKSFEGGFLEFNNTLTYLNAPKSLKLRMKFSRIIRKNKRELKKENRRKINSKDIAQLDRENELTTNEVNFAYRIFNRIRNVFRREDRNNNGR